MRWFKRKKLIGFTYEPSMGDWISIKGKWHHYIEVDGKSYFDGVAIN